MYSLVLELMGLYTTNKFTSILFMLLNFPCLLQIWYSCLAYWTDVIPYTSHLYSIHLATTTEPQSFFVPYTVALDLWNIFNIVLFFFVSCCYFCFGNFCSVFIYFSCLSFFWYFLLFSFVCFVVFPFLLFSFLAFCFVFFYVLFTYNCID